MKITTEIKDAIKAAKTGGTIIYPTDTIYGIGCSMFANSAIDKVCDIKKRDRIKPLSVAFCDLEQASQYSTLSPEDKAFIAGKINDKDNGYTFIAKKKSIMFLHQCFNGPTIGIRIPNNEIAREIAKEAGPIITTSANVSGENAPAEFSELNSNVINAVDVAIQGNCELKKPSIIIDLATKQVLRE